VIDSDAHWREFESIALEYLKDKADTKALERWTSRLGRWAKAISPA
jgi:hypothetical protein